MLAEGPTTMIHRTDNFSTLGSERIDYTYWKHTFLLKQRKDLQQYINK